MIKNRPSHIQDPSITWDQSEVRSYSTTTMQLLSSSFFIFRNHSSVISPKKSILKNTDNQKNVKSLFANAPKKKAPKKEEESKVETKDEDLFDNESEEEEDIIAVSYDFLF